jgi:hypothetical protein
LVKTPKTLSPTFIRKCPVPNLSPPNVGMPCKPWEKLIT